MDIEELYENLKCTEKVEAETPQRKPLKRKKIERRNTICDDTYKLSCRVIYLKEVKELYSVWPSPPPQKRHKDRANSAPPALPSEGECIVYYKEPVWSQETEDWGEHPHQIEGY